MRFVKFGLMMLGSVLMVASAGMAQSAGQDVKAAGKDTKNAAKDVGLIGLGDFDGVFTVGQVGVGVPEVFAMAKGGVKYPAVTVIFAPGDGIMAGVASFRMFVEDEEIVNF